MRCGARSDKLSPPTTWGRAVTNSADTLFAVAAFAIAAWINADAAVGATFGSMFFLLNSEAHALPKRLGYAAISAVMGYASGITAPDSWAMLTSAGSAAVAVVTLTALSRAIETEGLGAIRSIFDIIRGRK